MNASQRRHVHAVRFYEDKAALSRTVADFLGEGAAIGQPGLVITTPAHREALLAEWEIRHVDVDRMQAAGTLLLLDAREVLATFMIDGMPDEARFHGHVPEAIDRLCRGRKDCSIRAYGEMVDVLWQDGLTAAAIGLEVLWNQLATTRDFSLLCGYSRRSFYQDVGMREICAQHSEVIAAEPAHGDASGHF